MTFEILLTSLWLGLFSAGATLLLRVLPGIAPQVERGKKPWACDLCMSFWLIVLASGGAPWLAQAWLHVPLAASTFLLAAPAAYAVSLLTLRRLTDPGPPPTFNPPELIEVESSGSSYVPPSFSDPPPPH